nr:retroviral-like aspartic protease family protein [uncultured Sphingosinicella sp.]
MKLALLSRSALAALSLLSASASGQVADPAAAVPPEAVEDIGINEDGRDRMTVSTMIDGKGPYQFLIDTGAERTVISSELARRLVLDPGRRTRMHSMSGVGDVSTVVIPQLQVSKKPVFGIHAPALYKEHIGAEGMLGIDSLQSQRVTFDFERQTMSVTPSRRAAVRTEPNTIVVTARTRLGRLVLVDAQLDGQKLKVVLDTGSEVTIGNEALRQKLIGKKRMGQSLPIELVSVTGGKMQALYTRVKRVRLGGVLINDLPVAFAEVHPFRQLGLADEPALLLGMDALRLFDKVSVDFANRKVRFTHPDVSGVTLRTRMASLHSTAEPTR